MSLATQQKQCEEYCRRHGFEVDRVFVEEGESAKTTQRTQFTAMLEYCRENKGRIHQVVVYSLSRFARSAHDHLSVRRQLTQLGVTLRSVTEPFDDTSSGKLMEGILATFAQFDNDVRSERTLAGMQAAVERGRWPFRPPVGYITGSKTGVSMVPDPVRAPFVREAFTLFARGTQTQRDVLRHVTNSGLRTAKNVPLTLQTFTQMLRNPIYSGIIDIKGWEERVTGDFEAIIDSATFQTVQAVLDGKRVSLTPHQRNHPEFPLRQFIVCGECGRYLTGSFSTGRAKKRYPYYHCQNPKCKGVSVRKDCLEETFLLLLKRLQPKPEYAKLFREIVLDVWRTRQQEAMLAVLSTKQRAKQLQDRIEKLDEAYIYEQRIDRATYARQKDKLSEDLMLVEMELREAEAEECDLEGVLAFAENVVLNAPRLWIEFGLDQKQRFQRALFPEGVSFSNGELGTNATCLIFNLLQSPVPDESGMATLTGFEPRRFTEKFP